MSDTIDSPPLTGKVPADAVHRQVRRPSPELLDRLRGLGDITGAVSDALDERGVRGTVGASTLRPTIPGKTVIGPAVTVRNVHQDRQPYLGASERRSAMAEIEGHNQARPGDVMVIQGPADASSMGGISATIAKREGELGAVIDGATRDVPTSRSLDFPIWSRHVTPVTGKWRSRTVEVNGTVEIDGVIVRAGDIVVADDTGVCFIPIEIADDIVSRVGEILADEARRLVEIENGKPIHELANRTFAYKF